MNDAQKPLVGKSADSSKESTRSKPVLRDTAYRKFMDYLLSGQLKPGRLVSQRELCEAIGASIGAMREALKRLEAEGVVTLIPQRGVMVKEPSEKELNDIYQIRKIFEVHAVRIFAETGDSQKLTKIKAQTMEVIAGKAETRQELGQLSRERSLVDDLLHQLIISALNNPTFEEIFDRLQVPVSVSRLSVQPRFMDSLPGLKEHLEIIEALEARDQDAAEALMLHHLEKGRRRAVGLD